ncbi:MULTISPECIES: cytochrome c [unclassified Vibrio]|uniref:c-type cytochrome n=1 Tax=Vibrio TaxID=662 RepID=UPI002556118A|nr:MULTISPECIES: cytochrome c [unclassified Vibrio]MDK9777336.1 cytochrome c [Vibrio sp. D401a]MDK9801259.1 cytochrome c [Vibrio sp. D406a]
MRLKNTHFMSTGIKAAFLATMCFSPFTFASDAKVDEQFEVGKEKAKVCMTCHGADGISTIDAYPNLRGQKKSYLISSLKDYKARERTSGLAVLMQQQADALSDQDIEDIAHYYSQLGNEHSPSDNEPQP